MGRNDIYSIKDFYIDEFISFMKTLDTFPEQELKIVKLREYLNKASNILPIRLIFSYYVERLISTKKEYEFLPLELTAPSYYKINLQQLRYSLDTMEGLGNNMEEVKDMIYSTSGKVQQFILSYYSKTSLFGIRLQSLEEVFNKGFKQYITPVSLSTFSYDVNRNISMLRARTSTLKLLKFPVILFEEDNLDIVVYIKTEAGSRVEIADESLAQDIANMFQSYTRIALIGTFKDGVFKAFICTNKRNATSKLLTNNTLQNSFRYMLDSVARVNTTIKSLGSFTTIKEVVKADGDIYYDLASLLSNVEAKFSGALVSRNRIDILKSVRVAPYVISELDFIKGNVRVQAATSEATKDIEVGSIINSEELDMGNILTEYVLNNELVFYK